MRLFPVSNATARSLLSLAMIGAILGWVYHSQTRWEQDGLSLQQHLREATNATIHSFYCDGDTTSTASKKHQTHRQRRRRSQTWAELPPAVQRYLTRIFSDATELPLMPEEDTSALKEEDAILETDPLHNQTHLQSKNIKHLFKDPPTSLLLHDEDEANCTFCCKQIFAATVQQTGFLLSSDQEWCPFSSHQLLTPAGYFWQANLFVDTGTKMEFNHNLNQQNKPLFQKRRSLHRISTNNNSSTSTWETRLWDRLHRRRCRSIFVRWLDQLLGWLLTVSVRDYAVLVPGPSFGSITSQLCASWMKGLITFIEHTFYAYNRDRNVVSQNKDVDTNTGVSHVTLWEVEAVRWLVEATMIPTVLLPQVGLVRWLPMDGVNHDGQKAIMELNVESPTPLRSRGILNNLWRRLTFRNPQPEPIQVVVTFSDDEGWITRVEAMRPMIQPIGNKARRKKQIVSDKRLWIGLLSSYRWMEGSMWIPTHLEAGWVDDEEEHLEYEAAESSSKARIFSLARWLLEDDPRFSKRRSFQYKDDSISFYFRGDTVKLDYEWVET